VGLWYPAASLYTPEFRRFLEAHGMISPGAL
jgi:hypothetical protein